jgi:branched-subunit amino acid aminotransferase/4-amino-4-deoxychorismate lyase
MREAKRLGLELVERDVGLSELLRADEVFISSSLKLVIGVSRVLTDEGRKAIPVGPLTAQLRDHFRHLVGV